MLEKDFNTLFKNTLINLGFYAYKIPDTGNGFRISAPCDGVFYGPNGIAGIWEGKRAKEIKGFNPKVLETQQVTSLKQLKKLNYMALVPFYVFLPRHSFMLLLDYDLVDFLFENCLTLKKSDIISLEKKYVAIKKGNTLFDINSITELKEKIVKIADIDNLKEYLI